MASHQARDGDGDSGEGDESVRDCVLEIAGDNSVLLFQV